jgi:hypothetical protein
LLECGAPLFTSCSRALRSSRGRLSSAEESEGIVEKGGGSGVSFSRYHPVPPVTCRILVVQTPASALSPKWLDKPVCLRVALPHCRTVVLPLGCLNVALSLGGECPFSRYCPVLAVTSRNLVQLTPASAPSPHRLDRPVCLAPSHRRTVAPPLSLSSCRSVRCLSLLST